MVHEHRYRTSPYRTHEHGQYSTHGWWLSNSEAHGRPHIGANGVCWPPWKNGWKIKNRKRAKKQFSELGWSEGICRERRYADHMFIQIYFRMHHFVVKFSKFSSPQATRGHWPPNQNPADALAEASGRPNKLITVVLIYCYRVPIFTCRISRGRALCKEQAGLTQLSPV